MVKNRKEDIAKLGPLSDAIKAVGKRRRAEKDPQPTLSDWHNVFQRQADESDVKNRAIAAKAKAELRANVIGLRDKTNEELFEHYDQALNGGYSNHYLMPILAKWKERIKREMLARMAFGED
jgi:hypothetical protein